MTRSYGKHQQDIRAILYLPFRRLLRYQLLMNRMLKAAPAEPEEKQRISQLVDFFETLGKETELGHTSSKRRAEAWRNKEFNKVFNFTWLSTGYMVSFASNSRRTYSEATCSVHVVDPFDRGALQVVAIGCAGGVFFVFPNNPREFICCHY
jgi:hypothetical protein